MTTVKAVKMQDINQKELLYLVIENSKSTRRVVINVGAKTFNAVSAIEKPITIEAKENTKEK
nr:MAG: hypothetical protein [Microviridae sp.]